MNITELREKRANQWKAMEGFLNSHTNVNGVLSEEDDGLYNKMEKELDTLTNEIKRLERKEMIEAELNKPIDKPITLKPMKSTMNDEENVPLRKTNKYKKSFWNAMRSKIISARQNLAMC